MKNEFYTFDNEKYEFDNGQRWDKLKKILNNSNAFDYDSSYKNIRLL